MGGGLSSSASIECGFAFALSSLFSLKVEKEELIQIAQWSEHNFVGVKCGIMDQFASMMGRENKVILLDCRSMHYEYLTIDLHNISIVLCDTKVKHNLADSEYNIRRNECSMGIDIIKKYYPDINSLRDVSLSQLKAHKHALPNKVFDRCLYVVQEIHRVQEAVLDLENNDLISFGKKMFQTHEGLSKLYEVSCPELDFLVEHAKNNPGVLGARVMGGGFGGCTINLIKNNSISEFTSTAQSAYQNKFGISMDYYIVKIKSGTSIISTPKKISVA
jgi:galactokinase